MKNKAVLSILEYFEVLDQRLRLGGKTCSEIVKKTGTPVYVYDLAVAKKKLLKLKTALPDKINIHYAIKANPHREIISFFKENGTGFDVASMGELEKVMASGIDPEEVGFAGPGKTDEEIAYACRKGIGSLNVESINEMHRADRIAKGQGRTLNVSIRINPAYELIGSGMKMGGGPKQFGIDQELLPDLLDGFSQWEHLKFRGFHIFAGSQNLKEESISDSFEKALQVVESLLSHCPVHPDKVNLGGGFGIPYYENDRELDIYAIGNSLSSYLEAKQKVFKNTQFIVESGRYLVGECGIYLSRVIDKKESRGETFLILDGGMHHHLAASGNFGQVIKRNFPIAVPEKLGQEHTEVYNIAGPLCTPLDRLGSKVLLPKTEIGDLIGILASGAYGFSASPQYFLSHKLPSEMVFKNTN